MAAGGGGGGTLSGEKRGGRYQRVTELVYYCCGENQSEQASNRVMLRRAELHRIAGGCRQFHVHLVYTYVSKHLRELTYNTSTRNVRLPPQRSSKAISVIIQQR